jgi:hypothetical protein
VFIEAKQGKEVIEGDFFFFRPADTLSALFNSYHDVAKAIFRVDLINEFWDSVREDDPKIKALIQEVDWAPWSS